MAISKKKAKVEKARRRAQCDLLAFLRWCWWMDHKLVVGRHTRGICQRLTQAVEDWREGHSTYLLIAVPFRHGKSDIVSRALPAWFLGRCADRQPDVIMSGYGYSLVRGFSKRVKRIMEGKRYQALWPGMKPDRANNKADEWQVQGSNGVVIAQGLGGALTGKGGHLIIIDDYCRNRAEAASKVYRDKTWDSFRNDLMTRQNSPASIVIVCATPWHIDDIRGRIKKAMVDDPEFPQFEEIKYPARNPGEWDYLFLERFSEKWYRAQYASLGVQAAALLNCDPRVEGGNRFRMDRIVRHHTLDDWDQGRDGRGWDLASSSKDRTGNDPDWTWGIRGHVKRKPLGEGVHINEIWLRGAVACREEAPQRNALMRATAIADGRGVAQHVEAFGGYKDAYTQLRAALQGLSVVRKSRLPGDKSVKLADLEPSFEAGLVHVYVPGFGQHLQAWLDQFSAFPDGAHDDACDATAVLYHAQAATTSGSTVLI